MANAKTGRQAEKPLAYSYLRFSNREQGKGDSVRRQTELRDQWVKRNNCTLDTSLKIDRGVSGFKGKNRDDADKHGLAYFLQLVKERKVAPGSYLVVENLDRLSREHEIQACHTLFGILLAGVKVVQLLPSELVLEERSDIGTIMRAVMELNRGHRESVMKSERIGPAWKRKKQETRTIGKPLGKVCPSWLKPVVTVDRDKGRERVTGYEVDNRKADTVRMMFRWAAEGQGIHAITRRLNREKVRPIANAEHWGYGYVCRILSGVAVLGLYRPHRKQGGKDVPDGEPVAIYPAIITQQEYDAARGVISANRKPGRGTAAVNLFVGLVYDHSDNKPMYLRRGGKGAGRYLVPYSTHLGQTQGLAFPLPAFEQGVLSVLCEIRPADVLPQSDDSSNRLAELAGQRSQLEGQIAKVRATLRTASDVAAVVVTLREMELEVESIINEASAIRQKTATPLSESWGELGQLAKLAEQGPETRTRLRSVIRQVVERIDMKVTKWSHRERTASCVVRFVGGFNMLFAVTSIAGEGGGSGPNKKSKPSRWHAVRRLTSVPNDEAMRWLAKEDAPIGITVVSRDQVLEVRPDDAGQVRLVPEDDWQRIDADIEAEVIAEIQAEERKASKKKKRK